MQKANISSSRLRLGAASVLTICAVLLLSTLSQQQVALELGNYYQYRCKTGNEAATRNELRILSVLPTWSADMAEQLCQADSIRNAYAGVTVSWKPRTLLSTADLVNERYDVIWNRHHFLTGLMPDFDNFYDTLLHYDNYSVFWFSQLSAPQMTAEYFRGKRIGLMNDDSSHTHNLLPLTSLKSIPGLGEEYTPVYFDDAGSLYDSFYRGQIDLITGGLTFAGEGEVFRTVLDNSATAATFFVRRQLDDPRQRCDIIAALKLLTVLWQGIETHQSTHQHVGTHQGSGTDIDGSC